MPCLIVLVQLRRRRAFVWPVECSTLGIFQRKGQFSGRQCQEEKQRVRSRLLVPTPLSFLFCSGFFNSISLWISWHLYNPITLLSPHVLPTIHTSNYVLMEWPLDEECTGFFFASDDKSRQVAVLDTNRAAPASDNPPWGQSSAVQKESICFVWARKTQARAGVRRDYSAALLPPWIQVKSNKVAVAWTAICHTSIGDPDLFSETFNKGLWGLCVSLVLLYSH